MSKILKTPQLRKFIAIATALNLIFSVISPAFVQAQGSTPGFAPINAAAAFDPKNFVIPFNIGRISDSVNFNSDRVIVQIQDLHSHEETQRNIANILSYLDSKHTIDNIYVEGADKEIDAAWLGEIEEAISDSLLKRGILTGAELYLIKSQKPRVLKGIEDRQIYADNFKRLIKIYESKAEIEALLPQVREFLNYTAQKYYGKENKKINRLISKYKSGEISFEKYFTRIVKKAKKQNIYFDFYPSISLFADIMEKQNKLDEKKVNAETEAVLNELKKRLSFAQYKELIDYWQNRQTQGIFYFQLARFINEFNYGTKYESLYEFLNFTSLNQQINPIDLVSQERSLIWEMRNNAALNQKEKEIIFLSSYFELTEGFLSNKITWAEYKYFQRELPRFRRLWTKYTRLSQTPLLVKYYDLFESFYQANEERNKIFIKGVNAKEREEKERQKIPKNAVMTDVYGLIERAKKIDVIITGGFHTQEVSKILQEARQSYVVITPNVTENADIADKLFEEDVFRTSAYMQENAFQKPLFLQSLQEALNSKDPANIIFLLKENIFSDKELMENAKPEMLQKEINKLASGKFSIKLRDGAITVEIEGKEASAAIIEYPKRKEETKEKTVLRRAEKKSIENYNKALDNYRFLKNEKTKKELEKAIHKIEKYKLEHSALLETDIETAKKETQSSGKKPVRFIDALFASFNERKTIKKIAKAYGELLDKQAVEEIEKAQKKYGEILKEFLNSHSEYDASKLGSYEKGVQTIVYAAHKAYAITFKVIRIKAVADFAADIANVIVHLYWNILAKLKNDRPFLTSDITYLPKLKGTVPQECFDIFPQDMPVLTLKEIDGYKKSNDEKGFIVIVNNLSSLESMLPIESKIRNMRKYKFYRDNKAIAVFNAEGKITMAYIISGGKITDIISDYTVAVMEAGALDNNGIPKFAKPLAFYNFRERFSWVNAIKDRGKSHIILSSLDTYGNFSSNYQYRIINADEPYAFKDVMLITDEQSAITKGYILDKGKILLEFENLNKNSADIPVMVTSEEKDIIDKLKKEKNISKERIVFSKLSIYSELYVNNQKVMTIKDTAFKNCIALAVLGKKNRVSKVYLLNSQTLEAVEYNNVNIDNDAYPAPYMSKSLDGVSEYIEVFYYDGVDENGTPLVKENAKPVYYRAEILSFQYKYNISPPVYANKKIVVRGRVGKNEANIITKQIKFPKGSAGAQFLAVVDDKGKLESVHYQTDKGFTQIYSQKIQENPNSIFDRFFKNKNSLYYQAYTFILAPLWEEWLFRGVIPLVLSAFGVTLQTGLLISGILFIAAHYNKDFTLRQWLTLAAAALIYSLAVFPMFEIPVLGFLIYSFYSVTGYTPLPVLAHILYNLLTAGNKQFPITSIIERDYPLLKGKSAVTVLASNSTKPFSEVLEQARAKAALGTDVHILIPKTISSNLDGAAIKETQNSGLQHILSEVETQENGAKIHVHTYYEDNAQTADFAFDAFNWLLAEIGADNISMLEIDSKEQDIPKTLRARWEQANAKAATYYADGVSFQNRLEQSLEKQKTNRNGRNMKNGKILSTTFLVSGLSNGIFKSKEFTPFDSFVIETSVQEITKNKKKIRDFVKVGRENGKEVILRIKAQNKEDAKAALNFDFKQFRSKIKKNDIGEIGISGAILDFSNLENADILDLSIRAKTFYLNVKAENSDAVVALESKEHPQSYSQAGIENFSHTAAAEIGKDEYIEVNEQRIIDELDKAMDTDSRMVIIRGDVVRSLKNVGVFVDCLAFLSGNVKRWINKSALTSQGSFRKGKKDGLIRGKDKIKENDETPYNLLRKMRETYELKEREILLNKIDEIFAASYLERFKKSADAKECELIFSEAQGFLQGALESIESQNQYLKDRVFAISTDEDIIRGAFVEAKLNAVKSKEEIENLKEKSYIEPPQCLIKSQERENSLRETFNLLSDYIDNGYKDDKNAAQNKRIAISKLISMLPVLYKTEIKIESLSIKTDAMLDGVQAMLRAA